MIKKFLPGLLKYSFIYYLYKKRFYILSMLISTGLIGYCVFIYSGLQSPYSSDPTRSISAVLGSLILLFILGLFLLSGRNLNPFYLFRRKIYHASRLKKRILIAFSLGATIPTIIVAIFSTHFFNFSIQAWFDDKISKVLNQSITVGESYIAEHIMQLKETAISVSYDLSAMYYDLVHNPELFTKVLNAQAEMRSLDEAMVFQKDVNNIVAGTSLSFSLSFITIPQYLFEKAAKGEIVQLNSDPTKIRILIKLKDYNDSYLIIGRLVDTGIIEHIDKTNGAAKEYFRLKNQISDLQVKFSLVFILVAMILLLYALIWGRHFAELMVRPIRELVIAAEKVKNGDLSVQVPEYKLKKDELKTLSSAFNRMVKQIDRQQQELVIAQRSLAWSDVARRVAHEVKNPLTPIQLSADRLSRKFKSEVSDPEMFEKYIQNILRNTNSIKMIILEFVNFAKLPSPNFTPCEIVSLVNDLVESRSLINDKVQYRFTSNLKSCEFVCDITQINQVIVNLLQNSEEAFPEQNLNRKIEVELHSENDLLEISIADNGSGFANHVIDNATKAYITTKTYGSGLGLAIVERIVQEHYGRIELANKEEGGAIVKLIFDLQKLNKKLK